MSKYEDALLLREHGFSYSEIIRELYPDEWEQYKRSRDRRVYLRLKKRVWRLLRYAESKRSGDVDPSPMWSLEPLEFDDSGGERNPLSHRFVAWIASPRVRKAGLRGEERQQVEYEQLLYYYYNKLLREYDTESMVLWGTIRMIHGRVFYHYYSKIKKNVWSVRRAGPAAKAYSYAILAVALLLHGRPELLQDIRRELVDRELVDRSVAEWLEKIGPIVLMQII